MRARLSGVRGFFAVFFFCVTGCPADDDEEGDDEVGDTDPGAPFDPLEGSGGVPPGNPNPNDPWVTPSTLGNGLVHDTRLSADDEPSQDDYLNADLATGVPWSGFVRNYQSMTANGFRPAQIRADVVAAPSGSDTSELEIVDRTLYISDDDANYRTEIETYLFDNVMAEQGLTTYAPTALGARPTSIDTFTVEGGGFEVGYSLAWVYDDNAMPWVVIVGQSELEMLDEIDDLATKGYRPISLASRERDSDSEYAAIFVQDGMQAADWAVTLGIDTVALEDEAQDMWVEGFHPFRGTSEHGTGSRFNLLWTRRPPGLSVQVRLNLSAATFEQEDTHWRTHGYHLESIDRYDDGIGTRHAAIWLRYEPYLRWEGTAFDPMDEDYLGKYQMFHDQAIRQVGFATEIDCSVATCPAGTVCYECPADDTVCFMDDVCVDEKFRQAIRPSATLHILDGDDLVLSRAYTFAPAIYPDTPLDAPFLLASVSKSITATAVVREMDEQSLPLTTPFVTAAGLIGTPMAMDDVTVLDTLRNLGGFTAQPDSYVNHWLIDATVYGAVPIDGQEMLAYVLGGGHLNAMTDNYWDVAFYADSQSAQFLRYSNSGYSMLGELVRLLSGDPYEKYVVGNLLTPLDLEDSIFPNPGHKVHERPGPTMSIGRSYLVNQGHPYHVKPPHDATGQGPFVPLGYKWTGLGCDLVFGDSCVGDDCDSLYPMESDCEEVHQMPRFGDDAYLPFTSWSDNAGPIDPKAPDRASSSRYAGNQYLGGAPLAAGGWHGDGESLALLIRSICQDTLLMPAPIAAQLWDPQWWNRNGSPASLWSYGLGWYFRGNWTAWAGGTVGSMATVLHNREYDFTVVHLTNVLGNGIGEYVDPMMVGPTGWDSSPIGTAFPCQDDLATPADECDYPSHPY